MATLGNDDISIKFQTSADTSGASKAEAAVGKVSSKTTEANDKAKEGGSSFGGLWKSFAVGELAAQGVMSVFEGVKNQISGIMDASNADQAAMAQLGAGIASTGGAAGITAQHATDLAESISSITPVSKQAVMTGQDMLLTFTGIKGQAFDGATQAAVDMATKFNGGVTPAAAQVQQQALLLGKALNDPATGLTKLTREGVTFSQQQKDQIKQMVAAGNTAGAQAVMLQELQKEFGGAAVASGQTFAGGLQMAKNALDELKITAGNAFMSEFAGVFQKLIPVIQSLAPVAESLGAAFAQVADALIAVMPSVVQIITVLAKAITALMPALVPVIVIVGQLIAEFATLLLPIIQELTPLFPIMADLLQTIADVIFGVMKALQPLIESGLKILINVFKILEPPISKIIDVLGTAFMSILNALKPIMPILANALMSVAKAFAQIFVDLMPLIPIFAQLIIQIINSLVPYLPQLINAFMQLLPALLQLIPPLVQIITAIIPVLIDLIKIVMPIIGQLASWVAGLLSGAFRILAGALRDVIGWIATAIGWISGIAGSVLNAVRGFGSLLYNAGKDLIHGLINGVKDMVGDVGKAVEGVAKSAVDKVKGFLGIHSPSTVFHEIGQNVGAGLVNGINGMQGAVGDAMSNLAGGGVEAAVNVAANINGTAGGFGGAASSLAAPSNQSTNNSRSITIQNLTIQAPNNSTMQSIFNSLDQDTINAGKGLTTVRGAY